MPAATRSKAMNFPSGEMSGFFALSMGKLTVVTSPVSSSMRRTSCRDFSRYPK